MQRKLENWQLPLFAELELTLDLDVPSMLSIQTGGTGPRLTDEYVPEDLDCDFEEQLDLFDDIWADNLKQKYGICHPMSEDE